MVAGQSVVKVRLSTAHQVLQAAVAQAAHWVRLQEILKALLPPSVRNITTAHKTLTQLASKVDMDHSGHKERTQVLLEVPLTPSVQKVQVSQAALDR